MREESIKSLVTVLTGNIGSGKSAASKFFEELGAALIYADKLVEQLYEEKETALEIAQALGLEISNSNLKESVKKLMVSDKSVLTKLEAILHPKVRSMFLTKAKEATQNGKVVIYEVPLYFEKKMSGFKNVIVVSANEQTRIKRLVEKRGFLDEHARALINAQMSQDKKIEQADFHIENNGSLEELKAKVKEVYKKL